MIRCTSTMDGDRCQRIRWHGGAHRHVRGPTTHTWGTDTTLRRTYEVDAPWIVWTWLSTDRETRFTGRMRHRLTCAICGESEMVRTPIPRWGPVPIPEGGIHPNRLAAIVRHGHPTQRNPRDWAMPLLNIDAWPNGLPLDVFQAVAETAIMEQHLDDEP